MPKHHRCPLISLTPITDKLDQVADLASAVASSVPGSASELDVAESRNFSNFTSFQNLSVLSENPKTHSKESYANTVLKNSVRKNTNVFTFGELQNAMLARRLGYDERSPLLPVYNTPAAEEIAQLPVDRGNGLAARVAIGLALIVSALFLFGVWLGDEIMLSR